MSRPRDPGEISAAQGGLCLILAHPDDESFFAVGLIAQARRAGRRVELILATAGEGGTQAPGTSLTRDALARLRRREMRQVAALLGINQIHWLGLADRHVAEFAARHVRRTAAALRRQRPEVVFTFAPDGHNRHHDHVAIHALAMEALSQAQQESRLLPGTVLSPPSVLWTTAVPPWEAHDSTVLAARSDVDYLIALGADRAVKARALRLHHSQRQHIAHRFFGADESALPAGYEVFRHGGGPTGGNDSPLPVNDISLPHGIPSWLDGRCIRDKPL